MSAYGTDQSKLYSLRGGAESDYRDRSMEQSNSNSGNPYGYIPPTFNPNTSTWNIPMNYSAPTPQGVGLPTGSGQFQPPHIQSMAPQGPPPPASGGSSGLPSGSPSISPFPVQGPPTLTPPPNNGTPQPSYMPQFNDGSTASPLAKKFLPGPPGFGDGDGYMQPTPLNGSTSYVPSPYASTQPGPVMPDLMGNSALAQNLRHLKAMGSGPYMRAGGGHKKGNIVR